MDQPINPQGQPLQINQYVQLTGDGTQVVIRAADLAAMIRVSDRALRPFIEARDLP